MKHRAILFDFGGTLFSYLPFRDRFLELLIETARRHRIEEPADQLRRIYVQASGPIHQAYARRSSYLHRDLFGDIGEAYVRALGGRPDAETRQRFYDGQTEVARPLIEPREAARETLLGLRQLDLHLGIVSNIDDDQFGMLWERCGLDGLFDSMTTSEEAGSCKPDLAIYHHALAKTGGIRAAETIFVGDSPTHDIAGANQLGMTSVLIVDEEVAMPELFPESDARPDHVIRRLDQLLEIVASS